METHLELPAVLFQLLTSAIERNWHSGDLNLIDPRRWDRGYKRKIEVVGKIAGGDLADALPRAEVLANLRQ